MQRRRGLAEGPAQRTLLAGQREFGSVGTERGASAHDELRTGGTEIEHEAIGVHGEIAIATREVDGDGAGYEAARVDGAAYPGARGIGLEIETRRDDPEGREPGDDAPSKRRRSR